ncbi:hypothetical protein BCR37DRAFT_378123 [Protomyces lactucae-debilis]|uniref:Uncharacterized protein n=1 Tax=Protomyces lactucae-debilis TaxID=2754530 RepID=A0A1Y2FQT2_PROLT|nr:uncharacterized protein BCR37DRAFT_378123 [Protomyces lactucae-debilis]ORY85075.1 hypothetical protein BCR37DRAFT_378123 [Protomyces lactucae-debilis]
MVADDQSSILRAQARVNADGSPKLTGWAELVDLVRANDLAALTRTPAQLEEYFSWKQQVLETYPGVEAFILQERLHWERIDGVASTDAHTCTTLQDGRLVSSQGFQVAAPNLFQDQRDWKCLKNDFPYGFEDDITHLVVWLKHALPQDADGVLEPDTQVQVESFIYTHLCKNLPRERIVFFFNPPSLKSIGALEHFHVCLQGVDYREYVTSHS